jgi:hypothetical protein
LLVCLLLRLVATMPVAPQWRVLLVPEPLLVPWLLAPCLLASNLSARTTTTNRMISPAATSSLSPPVPVVLTAQSSASTLSTPARSRAHLKAPMPLPPLVARLLPLFTASN